MKAIDSIVILMIVVMLGIVCECQQKKVNNAEKMLAKADTVMWMADSIVGTTNTGTLDDPDSTCAEWMNKRCDYITAKEKAGL